jgi:hypothetical protein
MAMSYLRISHRNLADVATLGASPALVTALPVTNLQRAGRLPARTTSTADQTITGDWGSVQPVNVVALWRHNLSQLAEWRIELWEGANQTGTKVYDSGGVGGDLIPLGDLRWGVDPLGVTVQRGWSIAYQSVIYFTTAYARSFKITLSDSGNTAGYLQACRLWIGEYWSPSDNFDYGATLSWQDDSTQSRTEAGTLRTDVGALSRVVNFALSWMPAADRASLTDILREVGKVNEVFLSLYPEAGGSQERDYQVIGKFVSGHSSTHRSAARWSDQVSIAES